MVRSLLEENRFHLQFAGHETFPLRYGWLKKSYDAISHAAASGHTDTRAIFTDEAAIAYFGVGKNMVTSMRHWALACHVLQISIDDDLGQPAGQIRPTALGDLIFDEAGDPYLERPASLWLLHWHLASKPGRATTWYWAFNELNEPTFSRDMVRARLVRRCDELREAGRLKHSRITESTLKSDILCFIRTYATKAEAGRAMQEDNLECPLTELGLVQPVDVGAAFQFRRGPKSTLPDEVFLYGLLNFWQTLYPSRREFSVEALTHEPGSPGRVFLLDEESVAERLSRLTDLTKGAVSWDESTGMRQVYAPNVMLIEPLRYLEHVYSDCADVRAA
ncbi:DUF4007 family protein [Mesorhizobium sp.]|uniref:DUF4007 family protein n=1 Tax=Mesorhizobium sp. TaxID=1871066 RepID=UPI000FE8BF38|nr:DUF4007 family protein [Mesorhizobium sp.]RWD39940.1 MAG: DUF4007 family protein [Mesorhizobium sp.]